MSNPCDLALGDGDPAGRRRRDKNIQPGRAVTPQMDNDCGRCPVRDVSLFGDLPDEVVLRLNNPAEHLDLPAGHVLYREGAEANAAFTLKDGVIKLTRTAVNGRDQILRLLTRGDVMGAEGLMGHAYNHTATTLTPVQICRLPLPVLKRLQAEHPTLNHALLARWALALQQVENLALELGTKKAGERLAAFLLYWRAKNGHYPSMPLPLSRTETGALLGLTVETVSRFFADWKRRGYLSEKAGIIYLHDLEALESLSGSESVPGI
ncbi:Crp/Fnr family transcriptional regulator [Ectothiorhodospira lacustris]|uniref:Crp/Fnr family transcriptional regulator n=1 Tax=Ectothiorhodospira lacustris TaxID=2899127 RepID=UPI001EE7EF59|nr:Crp/Fnr family transcriptional regulator [Ectothiorhodospira lacustris]MCG5500308.1 Crp/Fnr family transcriptional regulator [Ectothiorhodospira lacustris]MCG5510104.1 Crp/Fnr family transcriptional regulator [Ectothiorhodospira lacustris]MCG5521947.1 Crp/Fnr family transcriptional regulator [Ectothiorhodospira lacustris]